MFSNVWKACPRGGERPVSHLLEPGNVRALVNDHTYCIQSIEDRCLAALNVLSITALNVLSITALNVLSITALNVLSICEADREKVERMTKGQGSNKHWATERMKRLQFSNFRQICKLTERTDASVYAKSLTEMVPQIKVPSILHGNKYEAVVLKKFAEHMGKNKSK